MTHYVEEACIVFMLVGNVLRHVTNRKFLNLFCCLVNKSIGGVSVCVVVNVVANFKDFFIVTSF